MEAILTQFGGSRSIEDENVDPMMPTPYRVAKRRKENHDTFTLDLECANGATAFEFEPGQFNMLYVHGVGEVPISISGDSQETSHIVHTTRDVEIGRASCRERV